MCSMNVRANHFFETSITLRQRMQIRTHGQDHACEDMFSKTELERETCRRMCHNGVWEYTLTRVGVRFAMMINAANMQRHGCNGGGQSFENVRVKIIIYVRP